MSDPDQLAAIRQRWAPLLGEEWTYHEDEHVVRDDEGGIVVDHSMSPEASDDARILAHAPEDVAWLLAEVERLTTAIREHRDETAEHDRLCTDPTLTNERLWAGHAPKDTP